MRFREYQRELWVRGNEVYSYGYVIAVIENKLIYPEKNLTAKGKQHIRYVAEQLKLIIIE